MSRFVVCCTVLTLTAGLALAATPAKPITLADALTVWLDGAVRIMPHPAGYNVTIDCYSGYEQRVPPERLPIAEAIRTVAGYLMYELADVPRESTEQFHAAVLAKRDWSPALIEMVREALRQEGYILRVPPTGVTVLAAASDPKTCNIGRCDCAACSPVKYCGCEEAVRNDAGEFQGICLPPRMDCNTEVPREMVDPHWLGPLIDAPALDHTTR